MVFGQPTAICAVEIGGPPPTRSSTMIHGGTRRWKTIDHHLVEQAVAVEVDEDRRQPGTVTDDAELRAGRQVLEGAEGNAEIEMGLVGGIALARERGCPGGRRRDPSLFLRYLATSRAGQ